jgi:hypothetical protein
MVTFLLPLRTEQFWLSNAAFEIGTAIAAEVSDFAGLTEIEPRALTATTRHISRPI